MLTGKDTAYGGSLMRPEAAGYGLVYFAREMRHTRRHDFEGQRAAVSGSGNVAQYAVYKAMELGAKLVSVSDSGGTARLPQGMNPEKWRSLIELKQLRRGRVRELAERNGLEYLPGARPWRLACNIALPCATQNELDEADARALVANGCM